MCTSGSARWCRVLQAAADTDEDAARLWDGLHTGRYQGMTEFATNLKEQRLLRRGMTVERAAAVLAAHTDVVNWQNLVERHGFTTREFEAWLVDVTAAAILRPSTHARPPDDHGAMIVGGRPR